MISKKQTLPQNYFPDAVLDSTQPFEHKSTFYARQKNILENGQAPTFSGNTENSFKIC